MIRWSEHAAANLEDAYEYIVYSNGEEAADKIADLIVEAVERLATYPMLGRTGRIPGTRELVVARLLGVASGGGALVLATHDPDVAARCDRVLSVAHHLPLHAVTA